MCTRASIAYSRGGGGGLSWHTYPIPSPKHSNTLSGVQEGAQVCRRPMASPRTPCDLQERQEAKPGTSSTSFLHSAILPAHLMASVTPSSSSSGCSPLEHLLLKLLVTPSDKCFPTFLSFFFKVSMSFSDLPQSSYGSPQSFLSWQPFAMFYLFGCCKTKCFSYLCPVVMGVFQIHH